LTKINEANGVADGSDAGYRGSVLEQASSQNGSKGVADTGTAYQQD